MVSRLPQKNRLRVPDHIVPLIRKSHPEIKKKIKAGLEFHQKEPAAGKSLKDELEGLSGFKSPSRPPPADKMLIRQNEWRTALFHRPAPC